MGSLQLLVLVTGSNQPTMPTKLFLFVLILASQAFSLPCPAPNSPCAISEAAACPSEETRGAGQCASGLECHGEECIVDQTALPGCCSHPGACKGVPGTCRSKRSNGGTEVKRNWKDWTEWGPCSAACGLGTRTRLRSATGEEGFEVAHGECNGDCSDDNENTNAVEPPEETFIPFFSSGIF